MRRNIAAGNWKMYKTPDETRAFFSDFSSIFSAQKSSLVADKTSSTFQSETVFFVPAYSLDVAISAATKLKTVSVGAQNAHSKKEGAFTGENSAWAMKEMGIRYLLIGHSERRELFGETDATCKEKVRMALELGLTPMLCVGEKLAERLANQTWSVVAKQLDAVFGELNDSQDVVVAYEPVWAIGTGLVATPEQAQEVHQKIRAHLKRDLSILYGGSVKPDNCAELMKKPDIDGFLVGGASLKANDFEAICRTVYSST